MVNQIMNNQLSDAVHDFVKRKFADNSDPGAAKVSKDAVWQAIKDTGTRLWLDTGDIEVAESLWTDEFTALTTNNSLLNKEIQKGIYDGLIEEAIADLQKADPGIDDKTLVLEIAFILNAYHGLRLVKRFDAFVSVELHTDLANDVERSVAYGRRYFKLCPERFIVKVPLTPAGYLAARTLRADGIPLNFTLGFSARQNYVAARLTKPTYVNVFMGRLNSFVTDHGLGDGLNVGEKATLATQRELLALRGAAETDTLLIGASIRSGDQIGDLAGVDVFTMPPKAAAGYRENPLESPVSRVSDDPDIQLAAGVALDDFYGGSLWEVPPEFKSAVDSLLRKEIDQLSADDVQQHFHAEGHPDFLPAWTEEEMKTASEEGKIPSFATWKSRLAAREVGLDALMNLGAFYAFSADQKALDDRIRSFIPVNRA
jgi:transaldolase